MPMRSRLFYVLMGLLTILLGLASRRYGSLLPDFLAENAGDALWAMMVYFGFRFFFVNRSRSLSVCLSFLFSFGIEFSQLYQAGWLTDLRSTTLGALVLGQGFLFADLIRYTCGILIVSFLDRRRDL